MTESQALSILKCLADKCRLRIVLGLSKEDLYVERLSQWLEITPATVSFHLKKLEDAGLVTARKDQYYTMYSLCHSPLVEGILQSIEEDASRLDIQKSRDEQYRQKVLDAFMEYGKLKTIPAQRKKKRMILEEMAKSFEVGKTYTEKEVNLIIADYHDDFCTLRREMIDEGLMRRENGCYWKTDSTPQA